MATTMEVVIFDNNIQSFFDNLESKKTLLKKFTDLYKTLTSHFTSLEKSIDSKTLTLDSKLQSLDSIHQKSISDLDSGEDSIPDRLLSLTSQIEAKKQSAIDAYKRKLDSTAPLLEIVRCLCRRMDYKGLNELLIGKRKESKLLRDGVKEAMKECVDPARMVLETVKEFVEAKATATAKRMGDKRWGCGVVVSGLFPPDELVKNKRKGALFARKIVDEAEMVVRSWKEAADKAAGGGDGGGGGGDDESIGCGKMGSAEVAMFLQVVMGFGLTEIFEFEFYNKVVMEFATRGDMAKLAVVIFGDKLADFIDHLIKNGKEVEAVYFASESGMTDRFRPASLLQSCMQKNTTEILKNYTHYDGTPEEANNIEMNYIRSIMKCVEDNKLEAEISVNSLNKRLSLLGKVKADKNKGIESPIPSNKRAHGSEGRPRRSGGLPPRSVKRTKYPPYSKREAVSPVGNLVSKYLGPYDPGFTASTYGQSYGASRIPSADQITQPHYGVPSGSAPSLGAGPRPGSYVVPGGSVPSPSAGPQIGSLYGLQSAYGVYDYGATTASTYQPPPYAPP